MLTSLEKEALFAAVTGQLALMPVFDILCDSRLIRATFICFIVIVVVSPFSHFTIQFRDRIEEEIRSDFRLPD